MTAVAFVVSPHGFGHASRTAAVIAAVVRRQPEVRPVLVTTVPRWFFSDSLPCPFDQVEVATDVGLVQTTSFDEDVAATIDRLASFVPPPAELVARVVDAMAAASVRLVVADIAPLGLVAAARAGVPSLLMENFTWDFIYDAYRSEWPELGHLGDAMAPLVDLATVRVHTRPCCRVTPTGIAVDPVSRVARLDRNDVRRQLDVGADERLVLVTMGGVEFCFGNLDHMARRRDTVYVVPGASRAVVERRGNLVALPHHSPFYHPDLVAAADAVVAKLGYSTLAECHNSGTPLLFIARDRFPESPVLADFARRSLTAAELPRDRFVGGTWLDLADELAARPRRPPATVNGADQVAEVILELLADVR